MKFTTVLSSLVLVLPLLSPVAAQFGAQGNRNQGNQGNNNQNNNQAGNQGNNQANQGNNQANQGNNQAGNQNNNDPQKSLTLDPKVIAPGFAQNGQNPPTEGQVASLTSTNNFINYCLTVNLPITDGKQLQGGSCNPTPIGSIPSVDRMPSAKFEFPPNGGFVAPNAAFQIKMRIRNLKTGNFVNAAQNYFAAPQQLDGGGVIIGHSHVVVEKLTSLAQTTPLNSRDFAFFKGLNAPAAGDLLTADVPGLAEGAYRLCSINTAANHQPAIVPVAQHGSLDDCVYFTAGAAPAQNGNNQAGQQNNNNNQAGQGQAGQGQAGQGQAGQAGQGQAGQGQGGQAGQGQGGQAGQGQAGQGGQNQNQNRNNQNRGGFGQNRGNGRRRGLPARAQM